MILAAQVLAPMGSVIPEPSGLAPRRDRPIGLPMPLDDHAILAAPIFAPDRRPGAKGLRLGSAASPMAGYAAVGAVSSRATASAVIVLPNGQTRVMHGGDLVDGWRLVGIEPSRLVFDRQGERHVLVVGAPATPLVEPTDAAQGGIRYQ
jgi:hypothetical protein